MPFVSSRPIGDLIDVTAARRALRAIAQEGGKKLEENTRRKTPVGEPDLDQPAGLRREPGTLRKSIKRGRVRRYTGPRGEGYEVRVSTDDPIAPLVEWSTKPHTISPRSDRAPASVVETQKPRGTVEDGRAALSWTKGGRRQFAKVVHHPGTKGQHMFALGAAQTEAELGEIAREPMRVFEHELVAERSARVADKAA